MKTKLIFKLFKLKFIWITLLLFTTLTACTAEEEELDFTDEQYSAEIEEHSKSSEEQYSESIGNQCERPEVYRPIGGAEQEVEEYEPIFLELEYMYSFEMDSHFRANSIEEEFTFFDIFGSRGDVAFDQINERIQGEHRVELPEYVDLDGNSFVALSIGRRLEMIYYFEEHRYDTTNCRVIARPVFERDYYPMVVFVHRVAPLPQYRFLNLGDYTDDFRQFNIYNNIPFEVWPYDGSMERGISSIPGDRIRGSTLGEGWQELTEPLEGYIHVEETYLRSLPTEHSRVRNRLTYGVEFTINGYVEGGMEIDGSGRWYYVWTPMGAGNKPGYIHSSFVTITSESDD